MDIITALFSLAILIISIMFHELAHATVADHLGDPTPRLGGRLTLNPIAYMDPIGSFLVPLCCMLFNSGFIIGWAKPVVFHPARLRSPRVGAVLIAIAGPLMNILIALVCAGLYRSVALHATRFPFALMLEQVVVVNISLALFNVIPIPPLDGHHILGGVIPKFKAWSERVSNTYGLALMIGVLIIGGSLIAPAVSFFSHFLLQ